MNAEARRIVRFLVAGVINTGFGYASYAAFILAGAPLWLAVGGASVLAMLFNFVMYGRFVFGDHSLELLPRFLLFNAALALVNFLMLKLLGAIGLGPLIAQALLLPLLAISGYFGMRQLVFPHASKSRQDGHSVVQTRVDEEAKPIAIRRDDDALGRLAFSLRMLADLQLLTCVRFLRPHLPHMHGDVLDVGCGEMPFRSLLPEDVRYTGIDVKAADDFGMRRRPDIVEFDGLHIPFPDARFDHILCTEVLEHAENPVGLIAEMRRVLKPGGTLVVTVPFSARVHHAPHDYQRFTRYALATMFASFSDVEIDERGDDLAVIANKLIVVCMRLANPSRFWRMPLLLVAGPVACVALGLAHLSLWFGWGSKADPLGYGVSARSG